MDNRRVTIYDLARELNISPSYVSKALNNHPSLSEDTITKVKQKAKELNYQHNSYAANLRRGSSRIIGVVVPQINQSFFSDAIAGIEEVCAQHDYGLVICQSRDSYEKECGIMDALIRQNVDGILISMANETSSTDHLMNVVGNGIFLIQFDRFLEGFNGIRVINDNEKIGYDSVKYLIDQGYRRIAFLGGEEHTPIYRLRKKGYRKALEEAGIIVSDDLIFDSAVGEKETIAITTRLLASQEPPDAFFTGSDHSSLCIMKTAVSLGKSIPRELGIIGTGNDNITGIAHPTLSAVDQHSMELGRRAAGLFFDISAVESGSRYKTVIEEIVPFDIIARESTSRT